MMLATLLAATAVHPTLTLSRTSGGPGTPVHLVGTHCPKPLGEPDTLAWHDHVAWMQPQGAHWRRVPLTRVSPTTVRAVFVVRRSDHRGVGLLDLLCGGSGGNATATFTVTR
jgi:hypothetical protein